MLGSVPFLSAYRADMAGGTGRAGSISAWLVEIGAAFVLAAIAPLSGLFSQLVD